MVIQLNARPGCPSVLKFQHNVSLAARTLGVDSVMNIRQEIDPGASCPQLLVNGIRVCSCFPNKHSAHCTLCGDSPDIPDADVIRWYLAKALGRKTVLFICSGNAVRSQMAEAIINHVLGDRWAAFSGGIMPMQLWQPVIQVLQEIGIDASTGKAKHIELFLGCRFDTVISLCSDADEFCTSFPGDGARMHLPFDDPMTTSFFGIGDITRTRKLRDDMHKQLCTCLGDVG